MPHSFAPLSLHIPLGSTAPLGTAEQLPSLTGRAHEKHPLLQSVEQHTPCAHVPLAHSTALLQIWPLPFFPQEPLRHTPGAAQSASEPHTSAQRFPLHLNGTHANGADDRHLPAPSHALWGVALLLTASQVPGLQTVPLAKISQPPAPSHMPLVLHDDLPLSVHTFVGSRSPAMKRGSGVWAGTLRQRPKEAARAQLLHFPSHGSSQHTPSVQKPDPH